jgi:hypothetical protein
MRRNDLVFVSRESAHVDSPALRRGNSPVVAGDQHRHNRASPVVDGATPDIGTRMRRVSLPAAPTMPDCSQPRSRRGTKTAGQARREWPRTPRGRQKAKLSSPSFVSATNTSRAGLGSS